MISRVETGESLEIPSQADLAERLPQLTNEEKDSVKESVKRHCFEAIAWYQPFHCYDDSSWGIHFDAPKLDVLASCLADALSAEPRGPDLAVQLAFRLTLAHELFHSRIDFAAASLELGSKRRRFLPVL